MNRAFRYIFTLWPSRNGIFLVFSTGSNVAMERGFLQPDLRDVESFMSLQLYEIDKSGIQTSPLVC
jgi:hypothetical protein